MDVKITIFILLIVFISCSVEYKNTRKAMKKEYNIHSRININKPKGIKNKKLNYPLVKSTKCKNHNK